MVRIICYIVFFFYCVICNFPKSHSESLHGPAQQIVIDDNVKKANMVHDVSSEDISFGDKQDAPSQDTSSRKGKKKNANDINNNNGNIFRLKDIVIEGITDKNQKKKILDTINIEEEEVININNILNFNKIKNKLIRECYFISSVSIFYTVHYDPDSDYVSDSDPDSDYCLTLYFVFTPALHIEAIEFKNIKNDDMKNEFNDSIHRAYFTETYIGKIKSKLDRTLDPTSEYIIISKSPQEGNNVKLLIEKKKMDFKKTYIRDVRFMGNIRLKSEYLHTAMNIKGRRENIFSSVFKIFNNIRKGSDDLLRDPARYLKNISNQLLSLKDYLLQSVSKTYNTTIIEQDVETIKSLYHSYGFLNVKVVPELVEIGDEDSYCDLVYTIYEGPQYTIAGYSIIGDEESTTKLIKLTVMQEMPYIGEIYREGYIRGVISKIPEYLQRVGGGDATTDLKILSIHANNVYFLVTIKEGDKQKVGNIKIIGNKFTNNKHILRNLPNIPADYNFNSGVVQAIQSSLQQCDFLNAQEIVVVPFPNRITNAQDIHCIVSEKRVVTPTNAQVSGHITSEPLFSFLGLFNWYLAPNVDVGLDCHNLNLKKLFPSNFKDDLILWKGEMHSLYCRVFYSPDVKNSKVINNFNISLTFLLPELFTIKKYNVSTQFSCDYRTNFSTNSSDSLQEAVEKEENKDKVNYPFNFSWNFRCHTGILDIGFNLLDIHNTVKGVTFNHIVTLSHDFVGAIYEEGIFPLRLNSVSCRIYLPSVLTVMNKIPIFPKMYYKPIHMICDYKRCWELIPRGVIYFQASLGLSLKDNVFMLQGCESGNDNVSYDYVNQQDVTYFHIKCMKEKKKEEIKTSLFTQQLQQQLRNNIAFKLNGELRYLIVANAFIVIYILLFMNSGITKSHNNISLKESLFDLYNNYHSGVGVFLKIQFIGSILVYFNPRTEIMNIVNS